MLSRRYDFEKLHDGMKQVGLGLDIFMFGLDPLGLLLFYGDLQGARAGLAKVEDAHKRLYARIRQGEVISDRCMPYPIAQRTHASHW